MGKLMEKYKLAQSFGNLAWEDHEALQDAYDSKKDRGLAVRKLNLLKQTLQAWRAMLNSIKKASG